MNGVKKSADSREELVKALGKSVGIQDGTEPQLAKIDNSTGTFFASTIDKAPVSMLKEAMEHFESEASVLRIQAETSLIPGSNDIFSKKSTYARLAAQAIAHYLKESH